MYNTIDETKNAIKDKIHTVDIIYSAITTLWEMAVTLLYIINFILAICMIVMALFFDKSWYYLGITIVLFFFEVIGVYYCENDMLPNAYISTKSNLAHTMFENYVDYDKMQEWERIQVFNKEIIPCTGLKIKEDKESNS